MTPEIESAWKDVEYALSNAVGSNYLVNEIIFAIRDKDVAEALRHYMRLEDIENGDTENMESDKDWR